MSKSKYPRWDEYLRLERTLLENMKQQNVSILELLKGVNDKWGYEDGVYRYYHQSFKVYNLQYQTKAMVERLAAIAPEGRGFCQFFLEIIAAGTNREFEMEHNQHWFEHAAPIVQAFLHARYFLEMAVKYAAELTEPPQTMPSGWAAMLCLYDLR